MPSVPDLDKFEGYIRHSQAFKSAKPYAGKNVLVVGSRSSAVDIISALVKQDAGQVYMSHRGGVCVLPRMWRGKVRFFSVYNSRLNDAHADFRPSLSLL